MVRKILETGIEPGILINVNFPDCEPADVQGVAVAAQGFRNQALLSIDARVDGRGNPYFWLAFAKARFEPGHGSDLKAIAEKRISVTPLRLDLTDEPSVARCATALAGVRFDLIVNATGALSIDGAAPEKTIAAIDPAAMAAQFALNATGVALALKHFAPLLAPAGRFATLTARLGSIGVQLNQQLGAPPSAACRPGADGCASDGEGDRRAAEVDGDHEALEPARQAAAD